MVGHTWDKSGKEMESSRKDYYIFEDWEVNRKESFITKSPSSERHLANQAPFTRYLAIKEFYRNSLKIET